MSINLAVSDQIRVLNRVAGFVQPEPSDPIVARTYLGTEVYDQLIFPIDGNEEIGISQDLVLNDVLFRVTHPKIIQKTAVQGRQGRVNELITLDNYQIEINGKIVAPFPTVKPVEDIRTLIAIENYLGPIAIAVNFLSLFGIDTIIIDRIEWPQVEGFYNEQAFSIQATSDDPIELQITG